MSDDVRNKAQRFLELFAKGKEFTEELLRDNERLRHRAAVLHGSVSSASEEVARLREQLQKQIEEHDRMRDRFREVEEENRDFAGRYVEIEQQNSTLANLYVASYQLHSTLDFREVIQIVREIVINFIGSECFAILLIDDEKRELRTIAAEGSYILPEIESLTVRLGEGKLGQVATTGESYFVREEFDHIVRAERPLAVIPLKIKQRIIGLIVIYQLLQQKRSFSGMDYELFSMLAGQAATAIFSAKLYSEAERRLNTIQGFLDLLTTA